MFRKHIKFFTSWVDIKFASVVILREIHNGGFFLKILKIWVWQQNLQGLCAIIQNDTKYYIILIKSASIIYKTSLSWISYTILKKIKIWELIGQKSQNEFNKTFQDLVIIWWLWILECIYCSHYHGLLL